MTEAKNQLQPYIFAPKALGLLALGGTWAIGFFENKGMESLSSSQTRLKAWAKSFSINAKLFPALGVVASGAGYWAYKNTEQKDYLYGAITMMSLLPITFAFIHQFNTRLLQLHDKITVKNQELAKGEDKQIDQTINKWVAFHRLRILAVLIGVGFYYVAETKAIPKALGK